VGIVVIACYRPKPGKDAEVEVLAREHVPILRGEGLVTDRVPIIARAADGTIVEVFEWTSQEAIDNAHENAEVLKLWKRYGDVCDYVKVVDLDEASQMWAMFTPVN
jgi:hypothetical protein